MQNQWEPLFIFLGSGGNMSNGEQLLIQMKLHLFSQSTTLLCSLVPQRNQFSPSGLGTLGLEESQPNPSICLRQ